MRRAICCRVDAGIAGGVGGRMNRRDFVRLGCATVITAAGELHPTLAQPRSLRQVPGVLPHPMPTSEPKATAHAPDFTLRIAPTMVELAPQVVVGTIGYSDKVPGPLLRV